jgi:putative DNA primase/helicase
MTAAANIAKALGGRPTGPGRYLCSCPVPTHGKGKGDRNPSLSVYDGDVALLVKCFAECDWQDVFNELRRRGLLDGNADTRIGKRVRPKRKSTQQKAESPNLEIAQKIWREETAPLNGTLGETYLTEHRRIDLDSLGDLSHCLRWRTGKQMIVALMSDPLTGAKRGIHRIFLNPDGTKRKRKMLGPKGVICLTPWTEVELKLGLSEGIEDGLHILSVWKPIWAPPDEGFIKSFPVVPGIEHITIFADNDRVGLGAAQTCADRWRNQGQEAVIAPANK